MLPRDIAVLESRVQGTLESFEHLAATLSNLTAFARFTLHVETRDEDRLYVLQVMHALSEQG